MLVGISGVFLLFMAAGFVLWLLALVDVLRTPESSWRSSQDRLIWALVVIFLNAIGAILWYLVGRSTLVGDRERNAAR